jgi:single-stranded-DNA-specific exonuclease
MNPTWKIRAQKPYTAVAQLSEALKIPHFVAQLLLQRGIESREQAQVFFKPQQGTLHDPFLMHNMSAAVARLSMALQQWL